MLLWLVAGTVLLCHDSDAVAIYLKDYLLLLGYVPMPSSYGSASLLWYLFKIYMH